MAVTQLKEMLNSLNTNNGDEVLITIKRKDWPPTTFPFSNEEPIVNYNQKTNWYYNLLYQSLYLEMNWMNPFKPIGLLGFSNIFDTNSYNRNMIIDHAIKNDDKIKELFSITRSKDITSIIDDIIDYMSDLIYKHFGMRIAHDISKKYKIIRCDYFQYGPGVAPKITLTPEI